MTLLSLETRSVPPLRKVDSEILRILLGDSGGRSAHIMDTRGGLRYRPIENAFRSPLMFTSSTLSDSIRRPRTFVG